MIRRARVEDKQRVLSMARNFHEASGVHFPFSAAHASLLFDASLREQDRCCFVIDDDGLHGVIAAQAYDYPLANIRAAMESFWWVSPRHWRKMPALIDEYEDWAAFRGCSMVGMGMIGGLRASRAFQRIGYTSVEQMFSKRITPL